jgi:hypothetical protein
MKIRQARKIISRAHPDRYSRAQVWRAIGRWQRYYAGHDVYHGLKSDPCDGDGPILDDWCPLCDFDAGTFSLAMAVENGRHPWGAWKCLMQRAAEGTLTEAELAGFARLREAVGISA